jgi:hypothetical protein
MTLVESIQKKGMNFLLNFLTISQEADSPFSTLHKVRHNHHLTQLSWQFEATTKKSSYYDFSQIYPKERHEFSFKFLNNPIKLNHLTFGLTQFNAIITIITSTKSTSLFYNLGQSLPFEESRVPF